MDPLLAGSEPPGKLPLKPPLWGSVGDGASNLNQKVPKSEQESDAHDIDFGQQRQGLLDQHCPDNERKVVSIGSSTWNENGLFLDVIMLQKMIADKESDANCWSRVVETVEQSQREKTEAQLCLLARQKRYLKERGLNDEVIQMQMDHIRLKYEQNQDSIRSYRKHIQSSSRDRELFCQMVQQIETTMTTTSHLQQELQSLGEECILASNLDVTKADNESYGLKDLVKCSGSHLERVVGQSQKVTLDLSKAKELQLCHDSTLRRSSMRSSSAQTSIGLFSFEGCDTEMCTKIHNDCVKTFREAAEQSNDNLTETNPPLSAAGEEASHMESKGLMYDPVDVSGLLKYPDDQERVETPQLLPASEAVTSTVHDQNIEIVAKIEDHDKNVKDMEMSQPSPDSKLLDHKSTEVELGYANINQPLEHAYSGIVVKAEDVCKNLDVPQNSPKSEMNKDADINSEMKACALKLEVTEPSPAAEKLESHQNTEMHMQHAVNCTLVKTEDVLKLSETNDTAKTSAQLEAEVSTLLSLGAKLSSPVLPDHKKCPQLNTEAAPSCIWNNIHHTDTGLDAPEDVPLNNTPEETNALSGCLKDCAQQNSRVVTSEVSSLEATSSEHKTGIRDSKLLKSQDAAKKSPDVIHGADDPKLPKASAVQEKADELTPEALPPLPSSEVFSSSAAEATRSCSKISGEVKAPAILSLSTLGQLLRSASQKLLYGNLKQSDKYVSQEEFEDRLKEFKTAAPDSKCDMMEEGMLPNSWHPSAIPIHEQYCEMVYETPNFGDSNKPQMNGKHEDVQGKTIQPLAQQNKQQEQQKTHKEAVKVPHPAVPSYQNVPLHQDPMQANMPHSAVPSQQKVQRPAEPKPQKEPENEDQEQDESEKGVSIPQLEVGKLVHTVVEEIWDMYDLGCTCRTTVFKMAKPQPSEEFLRNLTCARNIKTAVRNNYCKHMFELCWGILLGLYSEPDDSGYAWYKPRPEDKIQSISSSDLSTVKEYVTRKVFRFCGYPTEPKGAKHTQFHLEDELKLYPRPKYTFAVTEYFQNK